MKVKLISESAFTIKEHGVHTAFLQIKKLLEDQGVEVIVNSFDRADITHIHTIGPYSLAQLLKNEKTVVSAHVIPESFQDSLVLANYWKGGAESYLRYFYNKADMVLAVAPKVKDVLKKLRVESKIEVFPNPIDITSFKRDEKAREKIRDKHNFNQKDFIVISVGQIQTRKGVLDFLQTARRLPRIKFVWIGGKPFGKLTKIDKELEEKLKIPLQNALFLGSRAVEEMPNYYNMADVFFMPSYQENAPMAILEAGATSLPLVLRDLEEYKMLYGEGYLSREGFTDIISKLKDDISFREKYSNEAHELAEKFSFKFLGPKLLNIYKKVINL